MMDRTAAAAFLTAATLDERVATLIAGWLATELELGQLVQLVDLVDEHIQHAEPDILKTEGTIGVQSVEKWRRPAWWPYEDLDLVAPFCAVCGSFPMLMVAPNLHPTAFCQTDGCPAFSWDPSRTYVSAMWDWFIPSVQGQIGASKYGPKATD